MFQNLCSIHDFSFLLNIAQLLHRLGIRYMSFELNPFFPPLFCQNLELQFLGYWTTFCPHFNCLLYPLPSNHLFYGFFILKLKVLRFAFDMVFGPIEHPLHVLSCHLMFPPTKHAFYLYIGFFANISAFRLMCSISLLISSLYYFLLHSF